MAQIKVLDQSTINKIAAGEVIERPSSVVKELVENAIDAGASAVTIEIKDGGCSFIRITDNGSGIPKDQIQLAFLRHSTSKIQSVEDLLTISSLGFRGEALSSIAAVAQVELITKTAESLTGSRYLIDGGKEKSIEEIGAPNGTTFLVRNLFYNTPARRKFLKTGITEGNYISDLVEKLALSHPEISFRFISGGQNKLYTSGNGTLKDVIYGVYGREITAGLIPLQYECELFRVDGFIGKPAMNRGNRALENYYINGRYIKSSIISKAIEDAYAGYSMPKKYPFTSLHFHIDPDTIDINVHPTKMELRFSEGERVYKELYQAVHEAVMQREVIPQMNFDSDSRKKPSEAASGDITGNSSGAAIQKVRENKLPEPFELNRMAGAGKKQYSASAGGAILNEHRTEYKPSDRKQEENQQYRLNEIKISPAGFKTAEAGTEIKSGEVRTEELKTGETRTEETKAEEIKTRETNTAAVDMSGKDSSSHKPAESIEAGQEPGKENRTEHIEPLPMAVPEQLSLFSEDRKLLDEKNLADHKIIGQLFDTYWLIEFDQKLFIMDQHAAHEKVLYEHFMKRVSEGTPASQQLMPPQIITLTLAAGQVLKDNMDIIANMGFEIESFGGNEYAVRAVPVELYGASGKDMIMEIIDDLMENPGRVSNETIKSRIATMACKAAVKGNNRLQPAEVRELVTELMTLDNPYNCPHGRPTMISMSKYELEKKFKRIV